MSFYTKEQKEHFDKLCGIMGVMPQSPIREGIQLQVAAQICQTDSFNLLDIIVNVCQGKVRFYAEFNKFGGITLETFEKNILVATNDIILLWYRSGGFTRSNLKKIDEDIFEDVSIEDSCGNKFVLKAVTL